MYCFYDLEKSVALGASNRILRDKGAERERELFKIRKTGNAPEKAKTNGIPTCRPSERNPEK
jgi:hypothetical protein